MRNFGFRRTRRTDYNPKQQGILLIPAHSGSLPAALFMIRRTMSKNKTQTDLDNFAEKMRLDQAVPVFETTKDAVNYIQNRLADIEAGSPEEAARRFSDLLEDNERRGLFEALLVKQAEESGAYRKKLASVYELSEGYSRGEYPYKNRYPAKLYEKELYELQVELIKLQEWVKRNNKRIVVIFEGRDTAGKGGTIRRFVENLNPRGARIVALAKPTEAEAGQWYFQRYAAQLPNPGEICFFDRSWYNRGVVEPVMGFCTQEQTNLFLSEVAGFERSLVRSGIILVKFWLSISKEEQLRRFKERQINPLKRWKLSPVDIASIDKWDDYTHAMEAMFRASDSLDAPWTVIRNEDKRRGRLNAIRVLLQSVEYDGRNLAHIGQIDPLIVGRAAMLLPNTAQALFTSAMNAAISSTDFEDEEKHRAIERLEKEVKGAMLPKDEPAEQPAKPAKSEKAEKTEKTEKSDKSDKSEKSGRSKSDKSGK